MGPMRSAEMYRESQRVLDDKKPSEMTMHGLTTAELMTSVVDSRRRLAGIVAQLSYGTVTALVLVIADEAKNPGLGIETGLLIASGVALWLTRAYVETIRMDIECNKIADLKDYLSQPRDSLPGIVPLLIPIGPQALVVWIGWLSSNVAWFVSVGILVALMGLMGFWVNRWLGSSMMFAMVTALVAIVIGVVLASLRLLASLNITATLDIT
jgi:hypothetical protein